MCLRDTHLIDELIEAFTDALTDRLNDTLLEAATDSELTASGSAPWIVKGPK